MLQIDKATYEDVQDLIQRITADDAAELRAAGLDVQTCLETTQAQALRWRGDLVCLFGVVTHPAIERGGIPWMLCTTTLDSVPRRAMACISDQVVSAWRQQFDHLSNLVHRRNARAVAFVRWLGFSVGDVPCGPGKEFFAFEWRSSHV